MSASQKQWFAPILLAAVFLFVMAAPAAADTIVPAAARGRYDQSGFHNAANPSYAVGICPQPTCISFSYGEIFSCLT